VDAKDIKCPSEWQKKHKSMFAIVDFLAKQILGIVSSQIETERIFFLFCWCTCKFKKMSFTIRKP
jgi:hypothetical protein